MLGRRALLTLGRVDHPQVPGTDVGLVATADDPACVGYRCIGDAADERERRDAGQRHQSPTPSDLAHGSSSLRRTLGSTDSTIRSNVTPARAYASSTSVCDSAASTQKPASSCGTSVECRKRTCVPSRSSASALVRTLSAAAPNSSAVTPGQ